MVDIRKHKLVTMPYSYYMSIKVIVGMHFC